MSEAKSLSQAIHPMNKKGQTINSILAFLAVACLTSYVTAAESITQEKVNQIRPGRTTEQDLVRTFGVPTTETVCPESETSLHWFYVSPIAAQNYIPIIGPALGGAQVKAWELWAVIGLNGKVKRYIAYGHYANGEVKRYIEYGHYPH
jgi:outer membrane protein assembly factor BamE (lipoprotein component of BamABCDE complex)